MPATLTRHEEEILLSDFPDHGQEIDFDRETIEKYSRNTRSVRLAHGCWYTPREMKERARKAFSVIL